MRFLKKKNIRFLPSAETFDPRFNIIINPSQQQNQKDKNRNTPLCFNNKKREYRE